MIKRRLYQLFDTKANAVAGTPFSEKNDAAAVRAFQQVLANKDTMPGRFPNDFELRIVGEQDEDTGALEPITPPGYITVAHGSQWVEEESRGEAQRAVREQIEILKARNG